MAERRSIRAARATCWSACSTAVLNVLAQLGQFATFAWRTVAAIPMTLRLYHNEVLRQLKDIAWGSGALIVGGGTVGIMILLVALGRHVARHRGVQRPRAGRARRR